MLIRLVRMTFRADAVPAFEEIFRQSREKIRSQPGCRHLALWADATDPTILTTYSVWESEAALNQYRRSELFGSVWPRTKALFATPAVTYSFVEATI